MAKQDTPPVEAMKLPSQESQQAKREKIDAEATEIAVAKAAREVKRGNADPSKNFLVRHDVVGPWKGGQTLSLDEVKTWANSAGGGVERLLSIGAIAEIEA